MRANSCAGAALIAAMLAFSPSTLKAQQPQSLTRPVEAEPFGFRRGMKLTELRRLGTIKRGDNGSVFSITTAPKPHPAFESYLMVVGDRTGLCKVVGIGKTLDSSSQGTELQAAFDALEEPLKRRYGPNRRHDFLNAGSIWHEPNEWMMGLKLLERRLVSFWTLEDKSTLPGNLLAISLKAEAETSTSGYVVLSYEFDNAKECLESVQGKRDEAL